MCIFTHTHTLILIFTLTTTQLPDQYVAPPPPEYQERGNLRGWLLDNKARDQYVIRYADESEVLWNDPAPDVSFCRNLMCVYVLCVYIYYVHMYVCMCILILVIR
jgi:hypothetical protein